MAKAWPGQRPYDSLQMATSGMFFLMLAARPSMLIFQLGVPSASKFCLKMLAHFLQLMF